jgi:hypothetical protein
VIVIEHAAQVADELQLAGASLVGRSAFYQIELHLSRADGLTVDELDVALRSAQDRLAPGVA